jgi:acetyltransferase-like isoleucine patch superfamily enzyme
MLVQFGGYLTNHVVSRIPCMALRHWWYRRYLGIQIDHEASVHLGCYLWHYGPGQVRREGARIGERTWINRGCCLDLRGGLDIGADVSVSAEVMILTSSHDPHDRRFLLTVDPVVVEDNVWIASRATIMPGVTLGRGCVVAAGAVVTRDVAPLTIVAGVPARPVGIRDAAATHYHLGASVTMFE